MAHCLQSRHIIFTLINEEVSKWLGFFKWIKLNLILSLQNPSNHENHKGLTSLCAVNLKNPFLIFSRTEMNDIASSLLLTITVSHAQPHCGLSSGSLL